MRILFVTNLFPPHYLGGYELLCQQVCDRLHGKGHDICVLTSNHGIEAGIPLDDQDYEVKRSLRLAIPFGQKSRRYPWGHRATMRSNQEATQVAIRAHSPDVIFMWSQLRLTIGPARGAMASGCPVAWTFNDKNLLSHSPRLKGVRGLARWLLSHCIFPSTTLRGMVFKHSTAISNNLKEDLIAEGLPLTNCSVIHQGISIHDYPLKPHLGRLGSPLRLLYTGQLHEYKGVHTLLSAASDLGKAGHNIQVTIAGDGDPSYVSRLRVQARDSGLRVEFLGRVPRQDLVALYQSHDLFVFPSIWKEPFGLTHLEAMACGTPVISTANGGQGEFLRDGRNALVFKEGDHKSLRGCLQRLIDDPQLAKRIAIEGRVVVETAYTLEQYVTQLEDFLESARRDS